MAIEPAALRLRFRDDAATADPQAPPPVEAFRRIEAAPAGPRIEDDLGVLPGTRPLDPDAPLLVFLQHPEFEIPAPGYDHSLPDLESWSVRPTVFGWLASVSPSRPSGPEGTSRPSVPSRTTGPATRSGPLRHVTQVFAGCLALSLTTPTDARADAPTATPPGSPATRAPTTQPAPASPPATRAPTSQPAPASPTTPAPVQPTTVPAPPPPADVKPTPTPAPELPADSDPTTTPTPPPPRVQDTRVLADAAWEGVDGFVVVLELKGGPVLRGRVGAVQADTFTLIEGTDGQILVIPKSSVKSLRAYIPPPVPTQTGGGLIAGGSVLLALGIPVFITGITFVAICPSCVELHLPMLFVGGGALGGGIPMIARGIQRRTAFERAIQEHRVAPMVSRTPGQGWMGGLQFRF